MLPLEADDDLSPALQARAQTLFRYHQQEIFASTNKLFSVLLIAEWIGAVLLALIVSPRTWIGAQSLVHVHVYLALGVGAALALYPTFLVWSQPRAAFTRYVIAINQMLFSSLLIHLTGGRIETHFHVFGSLALIAFYRDWRVFIPATLVVALDHMLRGVFWPQSVFGVLTASPWRWVEHAAWVIFEDVFLVRSCLQSVKEMRQISLHRASLEATNERIEAEVKRQTTSLVAKEQQYRLLFEGHPVPMIIFDADTLQIRGVNNSAVQTYEYSSEQFSSLNLRSILAEGEPDPRLTAGDAPSAEVDIRRSQHVTAGGKLIDVEYVVHPASFEGQAVMLLAAQDVSRRLQMEKQIAAQHEVMMILATTEGLASATTRVLDLICERFECELGILWLWDEASGELHWSGSSGPRTARLQEFVAASRNGAIAPDSGPAGRAWSRRGIVLEPSLDTGSGDARAELALEHGLGSAVGIPLCNGPHVVGVFEFFGPAHDPRAVERAQLLASICAVYGQHYERSQMAERLVFLGNIVEASADAIFSADLSGAITVWNGGAARIYGYTSRQIIGTSILELFPENERAAAAEALRQVQSGQTVEQNDTTHLREDGRPICMNTTFSPIYGPTGERVGISCIARDVTEQKRLQSRLGQAQKLESIGQLAAGIAHEINTPTQYVGDNLSFLEQAFGDVTDHVAAWKSFYADVAPFLNGSDLTERGKTLCKGASVGYLSEEVPDAILSAQDGVKRITEIVRAMKEFSHPGSRDKESTDLNPAILSTATVARGEYKYWADLTTELDPDLPPVPCYLSELNQVILNLIINASHAIRDVVGEDSGQKGHITISTHARADKVEIRITDTGTGIPEAARGRVFDPFFTTKEVGRGTGQGLAIAHDVIVTKHGGHIHFETELGVGTTFIIELPLQSQSLELSEAA